MNAVARRFASNRLCAIVKGSSELANSSVSSSELVIDVPTYTQTASDSQIILTTCPRVMAISGSIGKREQVPASVR